MKPSGISPALKSYLPFIVLFAVLVLIFPRTPKFGYEYKKGSPWKYETLYSQFDFPILKTEEQIQEEKSNSSSSVVPYYRYSEDIVNKNLKALESLEFGQFSALKPAVIAVVRDIYSQGVVPDEGVRTDKNAVDISKEVLYIQRDKRASKFPVTEVYKQTDAKAKLLAEMGRTYRSYNLDSLFKASSVYDFIVPNLVYDKQTTELVHAESGSTVSPTMGFVSNGQLIVSSDEIVTAEIAQMLDSYKVEYEANLGYSGPKALFWLGNILLAFALVLAVYLAIYFTNRKVLLEMNKLLFVLLVFLISTICALTVGKSQPNFLYMVPFTLSALWLQAFFKNRAVLTIFIVSLLPLLIFTHSGSVLFVMFLVGGFVAIYAFKYFARGWQQFITAMLTFVTMLIVYFGFRLIDGVSGSVGTAVTYLFIGSVLTVLGYQMVYLFEKVFDLVSNSRLAELGDTSNPLLRELESKAPGTFQHSLQVMTMADKVARSVGANALLIRAGALYHDIGKMNNPQCFIENESLMHVDSNSGYHSGLDPKQSAKDITSHVAEGLEMADKYNLPEIIKGFIRTHHGTGCARYFLNKYLNDGGDPEQVSEFYYSGEKPSSKEQIILMLCDSIEAASRTLKSSSPDAYSDLVENIVASKMSEGQFDNADISMNEITIVKDTIKSYLAQLYHERVEYPKRKAEAAR